MNYKFSELVDLKKLDGLMQSFYRVTGISSSIIDPEGNILIRVGWLDICTKFHRVNEQTALLCNKNDRYITECLNQPNPYIYYKCDNGLIDAAAPIIVDGKHIATIFRGQFIFEPPDLEYFRQQAQKYGFDEQEYLSAMKKIPVLSKEQLDSTMAYFLELASLIAEMGLAKLQQLEAQKNTLLAENTERLTTILRYAPNVAFHACDIDGNILYCNKTTETLFELSTENIIGKNVADLLSDKNTVNHMLQAIQNIASSDTMLEAKELNFITNSNKIKLLSTTIFPIHFRDTTEYICMATDITNRKKLENRIALLDRLHLVGEMATNIGHEIRNPMTTVRGFLQMFKRKPEYSKNAPQIQIMIEELDNANAIITEFINLAKNKNVQLATANLNKLIISIIPLIQSKAIIDSHRITTELNSIPDLLLDEKEIRQLILNITNNAIEAMEPGGTLTIKTYIENSYAVLAIQDEGYGIPKDILEKLGTPFITTKDSHTGLGLAVCYSIAARHKAKIKIETSTKGTCIYVRFKYLNNPVEKYILD